MVLILYYNSMLQEPAAPTSKRPSAALYASLKPKSMQSAADAAADHSLVTPTPSKKPRSSMVPGMMGTTSGSTVAAVNDPGYDRKRKSLGALAVIVTDHLASQPPGTIILVDELAKELLVERRRIYDVINILESVYMVTKHAKNTYVWLTANHLPQMMALLQQEAMQLLPADAVQNGLVDESSLSNERPPAVMTGGEAKSLCRLSQQFMHIFLVGNEAVSLADASVKISGRTWTEQELAQLVCKGGVLPEDPKELATMAAKGLKTKIRRLYDVGNVLTAIGVLTKLDERYWARNSNAANRPMYSWSYHIQPHALLTDVYPNMPENLKEFKMPLVDGSRLAELIISNASATETETKAANAETAE